MSGGLSNEDFRKILFTPRPGGAKPDLAAQARERQQKKAKKERPPRPPPQGKQRKEKAEGEDKGSGDDSDAGPAYRDRAAERRRGMDDAEGAELLDPAAAAAAGLSYEESKYLGGDMAYTHLVKGLDYALLNKVRSEQQGDEDEGAEAGGGAGGPGPAGPASSKIKFAGPLGRAVFNALLAPKKRTAQEPVAPLDRFLPRRCAFVFQLDASGGEPWAVPTTLLRAKEDCPPPMRLTGAAADAAVLDRLAGVMAYMGIGDGRKRRKKKEVEKVEAIEESAPSPPAPAAPRPVDEDEDIFADAGTDYVAERRKPAAEAAAEPTAAARKSYFEGKAAEEEEVLPPPPKMPTAPPPGEKKAKKAVAPEDDGYAECYPSYYDDAGAIYDSEDDDGRGFKRPPLDEDTQKQKQPSAKLAAVKEKNKQDAELVKLQKVFEEKGYGNEEAFVGKKQKKAAAPDDAPAPALTKRRRI